MNINALRMLQSERCLVVTKHRTVRRQMEPWQFVDMFLHDAGLQTIEYALLIPSGRTAVMTSTTVGDWKLRNAHPSGTVEKVGGGAIRYSHLFIEEPANLVGVNC